MSESVAIKPDEVVVEIKNVSKTFRLNHTYSLKDAFVNVFKGFLGIFKTKKTDTETDEITKNNIFSALNDVSLDIRRGETVGLVGLNGCGKSTLLKCISGVQKPDIGSIKIKGRIAGLIEVGAGFHPDLTGRDNVYLNGAILGMSKEQIDASYDSIVEFAEVEKFMDTNVRYYSSGMFMRLAFAVAIHSDPDIFLVDEVLSVGDAPFRRKCFDKIEQLQKMGKTMVIVSHIQSQIRNICDRAMWLDHGNVVMVGDADDIMDAMQENQREDLVQVETKYREPIYENVKDVTREQMAVKLWKLAGSPEIKLELIQAWEDFFTDVKDNTTLTDEQKKAIYWLASQEITVGKLDTDGSRRFLTGNKMTRPAMIEFTRRFSEAVNIGK